MHSSLLLVVIGVIAGYVLGHIAPLEFTVPRNPKPPQQVQRVPDLIPLVATTTVGAATTTSREVTE